jgi:RNA polymerase sigma-70 factor (family 1)
MNKPLKNVNDYFFLFQDGDESGFDHYFHLYYKALVFYARRILVSAADAEEVVSECFLKVWEKRAVIREEAGLKQYLYTAVYRACLRRKEQLGRQGDTEPEPPIPSDERTALDNMVRAEVMREVYQAIQELPVACRNIFTKLFLEGKTAQEIAAELNLSVSTINTQKARALAYLRNRLSPLGVVVLFATEFTGLL